MVNGILQKEEYSGKFNNVRSITGKLIELICESLLSQKLLHKL